jgi:hypothetical protein
MTKFADQLFDDLMREHGPALAQFGLPAQPRRTLPARRALLAGGGTVAIAGAIVGSLVAGGGAPHAKVAAKRPPAYVVTKHANGTITLAVYRKSGFAGANARLAQLGDGRVVVVPVEAGCPDPPPPPVFPKSESFTVAVSDDGSITVVNAQGIPAGEILVVAAQTWPGLGTQVEGFETSAPPPSCVGLMPKPPSGTRPVPPSGTGSSGS